ncbi:MAG: adenylate/guanylate cyclase domain-containing protein [Chitinophagales bacterium]
MDSLKKELNQAHGKEKLQILNELTSLHLSKQNTRQALKYAKQAEMIADRIILKTNRMITEADFHLKPLTYLHLGEAYQQRGDYQESKIAFENALASAKTWKTPDLARKAEQKLEEIEEIATTTPLPKKNFFDKALKDISSVTRKTTSNLNVNAAIKLGEIREKNGNYERAIRHYKEAIDLLKDKGDSEKITELQERIADLLEKDGNQADAVTILKDIKQQKEDINDPTEVKRIEQKMETITKQSPKSRPPKIKKMSPQIMEMLEEMDEKISKAESEVTNIRQRAEQAENTQNYKESLSFYKKYVELEKQVIEEKRQQELALLEKAYEIENQEQRIDNLKKTDELNKMKILQNEEELKLQRRFQQSLGIGLFSLAAIVFMLYLLYHNKKRDHLKLSTAYNKLEITQNDLKEAENRIKNLLSQQVSKAVANELLAADGEQKIEKRFVCVMFLDIRNFTPFVEKLSPEEIIGYQNDVFGFMMDAIIQRKGIVNQIMGDGFMATFGATQSTGNDCMQAYLAAREIMDTVRKKSTSGEIPPTKVGIGLHAGYVVTGNVGTKNRKQFSVTGSSVIIAARLEQLNKKYKSTMVISKDVFKELPADVQPNVEFKETMVKGMSDPIEVAAFY